MVEKKRSLKNLAGHAGRYRFVLPNLPRPEYDGLQKLCHLLSRGGRPATQLEVVCVGLHLMAHAMKGERPMLSGPEIVLQELELFRATPPSEAPPLI